MSLKRRLLDHTIAPLHHLTESQKASFTIQRIPPKLLSPNRVARTINPFDKITATGHGKSAAPVYDKNKSDMSHAVYHEDKRVLHEETTYPGFLRQNPHRRDSAYQPSLPESTPSPPLPPTSKELSRASFSSLFPSHDANQDADIPFTIKALDLAVHDDDILQVLGVLQLLEPLEQALLKPFPLLQLLRTHGGKARRGKKQNKRAGTAHHKKMQEEKKKKPMTRADSLPTCRHGSSRMLDQVGENWVDQVCWFHAQNAERRHQDCQRRAR
jgi:hypothetical protein